MNKNLENKWDLVEQLAERFGVKPATVRKWKSRGEVPGKFHIRMIVASEGKLAIEDFMR